MSYDCLVIGGGLAGLTCAIRCAKAGLKTAVISAGANSLHFSSGSIDVLGVAADGTDVEKPFERISGRDTLDPDHPYLKIGAASVRESLDFFRSEVGKAGLDLYAKGEENHRHFTALGVMKRTYLSQESVYNDKLHAAFKGKEKIAILNFDGYRDYHEGLAFKAIAENPLFAGIEIVTGKIALPYYTGTRKNLLEFRSIDLARIFETERYLPRIAAELKKAARGAGIISLPAFLGIHNFSTTHKRLEEMTGSLIYEVPSLPPSILGLRLDNALRARLGALGSEYCIGDKVTGARVKNQTVEHVVTQSYPDTGIRARYFLLASGSFFSGGLKSTYNSITEPVFDLKLRCSQKRSDWYSQPFLGSLGHPFISYGAETDPIFRPLCKDGTPFENLFCAGAILAGYDPVREASGGGVAVSTGYHAASEIIRKAGVSG